MTRLPENAPDPPANPNALDDITDEQDSATVTGQDFEGVFPSSPLHNTKPYLVILSGKDQGKRFELVNQISYIGRNENADIVIRDPQMSRNHGRVVVFPDRIVFEDLNSTNGTYVDGLRIDKLSLGARSRIRIGGTLMKIDYKDSNEARVEEALYRAANTDALTGILNRRAFIARVDEEIAVCRKNDLSLAIVMCDADHFKRVNDTYSHLAGDYVLKELARLISEKLRSEDEFARYGGEEFIILLRHLTLDSGTACCERIRAGVESHRFNFQGQIIPCTLSIGLCVRRGAHIGDLESMIQGADEALLTAKRKGRNRVQTA